MEGLCARDGDWQQWKLSQGSVRAAELAAQSCRARPLAVVVGDDGGWKAQGSGGGSGWDSVVVCTTPAVAGTAAAETGRLWERRRHRLGASGLRWDGENVK